MNCDNFMTKNKIINHLRDFLFLFVSSSFFVCLLYACASVGSPTGGAIDETPPRFVSSNPLPNTVNFSGNKVEIVFDELIQIESPMEKVIITPPQIQFPVIKTAGRKAVVEIKDSLRPNTTYTIDFSDAIVDNNEKNPLENFSFAFSTGETVDSMVVAGTLLNAENLEPMKGVLIGLHENLEDSAFTSLPFFRTSKTNERGQFWIRNVAPGTYRIYALNDLNRDYKFDQPGEEIAFYDSLIIPSFIPSVHIDTLWQDSITVDTIIHTNYNHFTPDDVVLLLFKEKFERQYLRRSERSVAHKFALSFNAPVDTLPEIRFLNAGKTTIEEDLIIEYTEERRTLNYWLSDSLTYKMDTLQVEASYYKSDSVNQLVRSTDTLSLFVRGPSGRERKPKKQEEEKIEFLGLTIEASSSFDVFDTISIKFSEPLATFESSSILLLQKMDTVRWDTLSFSVLKSKDDPKAYQMHRRWEYETEYKVSIDSAVFTGIYGKWNDAREITFKTKAENDYGHLYVNINGADGAGFGELLDGSDKVVRKSMLEGGGVLFMNLKPAKYYLRYIVDTNNNGIWDTGNYNLKQQPEPVYYYPNYIEIPQNWQVEETWNVTETPITEQKLLEITKNKPKEKKRNTNSQNNRTNDSNTQQRVGSRQPTLIPAQR